MFHFTSGHHRIVWLELGRAWCERGGGGVLRGIVAVMCGNKYPLDLSCCMCVKISVAIGLTSWSGVHWMSGAGHHVTLKL